jgi:uncharacterized membrane-anchored protein
MNNKITLSIIGIAGIALITGIVFITQNTTSQSGSSASAAKDNSRPVDPQDIVPGVYPNQIKNTATADGLTIVSGLVENNIDAQGKITSDHLELSLKNNSGQDMNAFEVFYSITDLTTGKNESYYKNLKTFALKSGEQKTIHFDGKAESTHFGVNKDGLYFTSKNKLQFDIQVSSPGFRVAQIQLTKDAGGAELKD